MAEIIFKGFPNLTEEEINNACEKVIELVLRFANNQKVQADYKKAHLTAKKIAENSAVLLKNDGSLPLTKPGKVIILGKMAEKMRIQGGGSSHINATLGDNVIESLKKKGFEVEYEPGYVDDDSIKSTEDIHRPELIEKAVALAKKVQNKIFQFFCSLVLQTAQKAKVLIVFIWTFHWNISI